MISSSKRLPVLALGAFLSAAHAIEVKGTAPVLTVKAAINPVYKDRIEGAMNQALTASFNKTIADANADLSKYNEQKELAQGFANANAYSTHSGSLMGYQNYDLFAVSTGFLLAVQAPTTNLAYAAEVGDDIKEKGDLYAGIGVGVSFINVGINAGFLVPGLYLNAKYGGMGYKFGKEFEFDFMVFGVGANYRVFDSKSLAGIVKWRGISVGTGYYFQSSEIHSEIEGDPIVNEIPIRQQALAGAANATDSAAIGAALDDLGFTQADPSAEMDLTPVFDMGLKLKTSVIPLEASTAISFLFGALNISAGIGTDLVFGSSDIILEGKAVAETETPNANALTISDADVTIDGGSDGKPSFMRTRLMAGAGIGLGPVKIDVPLYWYIKSGAAFGLTAALVW